MTARICGAKCGTILPAASDRPMAAGQVVPQHAPQIRAVILCGTLIYELIGPAVTKFSLKKAGEITGQ